MAGDRAGTLIRVSSGGQDEANQVPDVERYIREHGYREVKGKRHTLHDKSAYKGEQQEALDQVVADMQAASSRFWSCGIQIGLTGAACGKPSRSYGRWRMQAAGLSR